MTTAHIESIKPYLLDLQNRIIRCIEAEEGQKSFYMDPWQYGSGGGGVSAILQNGKHIEKAGVNFSHIIGTSLPKASTDVRACDEISPFQAIGLSTVIHPVNPYAPTTHMNVRFIHVKNKDESHWWFGGGFDLTPYYGFDEDCIHWHSMAKAACDPFGREVYAQYKAWADRYFFLPHRQEPRGIGGIFFDDLNQWGFDRCFQFMQSVGNHFIRAYQPILTKRKSHFFTQCERDFQCYRRGRYVEFNLLYDRGTLFGLQSQGRTESIFMSLPPLVSWPYRNSYPDDSAEENLEKDFLVPRDWVPLF